MQQQILGCTRHKLDFTTLPVIHERKIRPVYLCSHTNSTKLNNTCLFDTLSHHPRSNGWLCTWTRPCRVREHQEYKSERSLRVRIFYITTSWFTEIALVLCQSKSNLLSHQTLSFRIESGYGRSHTNVLESSCGRRKQGITQKNSSSYILMYKWEKWQRVINPIIFSGTTANRILNLSIASPKKVRNK